MALFELGMLRWINRLIRVGSRIEQTSNAYTLLVAAVAAFIPRPRCKNPCGTSGGQLGPQINLGTIQKESRFEQQTAAAALAQVAAAFRETWRQKWRAKFA